MHISVILALSLRPRQPMCTYPHRLQVYETARNEPAKLSFRATDTWSH